MSSMYRVVGSGSYRGYEIETRDYAHGTHDPFGARFVVVVKRDGVQVTYRTGEIRRAVERSALALVDKLTSAV